MGFTCLIEFENNQSDTYLAGQTVSGKVTLTVEKLEKVKAVILNINGCADTRWSEDEGMGDDKTSVTYSAHIDYFKTKKDLFELYKGSSNTNEEVIIKPGTHSFNFSCYIPPQCPSSVEGLYGYIRYWVEVTLKRSWKVDTVFKKCFTIINMSNFNFDEDLKLPVTSDISKIFCCGPCKSDPLNINVKLPQNGFVPGQLIPINILVTNETRGRINEICVRLVMVINFFSTRPREKSKSQTKIVSTLIGDPVVRNCKKHFSYLLPIPATPPTSTTLCNIIKVLYRVEVEAKMGILYTNQCIHIPVSIGNISLNTDEIVVQQQPMPRQINIENDGSQVQNSAGTKVENSNNPVASNYNVEPRYVKDSGDYSHDKQNFTPDFPIANIRSPRSPQLANCDEIDAAPPTVTNPVKTTWL